MNEYNLSYFCYLKKNKKKNKTIGTNKLHFFLFLVFLANII